MRLRLPSRSLAAAFVLKVRPHLQVDLEAFVAKEREKRSSKRKLAEAGSGVAPDSEATCSAEAVDVVPGAMTHLLNRTNDMRPWSAPTVLVIAHWKEDLAWTKRPELAKIPKACKRPNAACTASPGRAGERCAGR